MKEKFLQYPRQSRPGRFCQVEKNKVDTTRFEVFASGSVRDLSFLVNEVSQTRILVPLRRNKDGAIGDIIIEVGEGDQGIEYSVVASTFQPIQPAVDGVPLVIPSALLFKESLEDWEWASLTPEQEELRKALRWACEEELRMRRLRERDCGKGMISSETIGLHARHLMEKRRFWKINRFRYVDARGSVIFERRYDQKHDVRLLVLVRADDDHELAPLLDTHEEVAVNMWHIFDMYRRPGTIGDLHDISEARKKVSLYVAGILSKIGYVERDVTGRK